MFQRGKRWRVKTFSVAIDEVVSYSDYTVTIRSGDTVRLEIRGIRLLQTFRKPRQYLGFYIGTDDTFPGTGEAVKLFFLMGPKELSYR